MKARSYPLTASESSDANLFESLSFEKKVLKSREPMGYLSPKWARLHLHPIEELDALSTLYWSFRHVEAKRDRVIEA